MRLAPPVGGVLGASAAATVTILDDDTPPSPSVDDGTVVEGHAGAVIASVTVRVSAPSEQIIQVDYATADWEALAGAAECT